MEYSTKESTNPLYQRTLSQNSYQSDCELFPSYRSVNKDMIGIPMKIIKKAKTNGYDYDIIPERVKQHSEDGENTLSFTPLKLTFQKKNSIPYIPSYSLQEEETTAMKLIKSVELNKIRNYMEMNHSRKKESSRNEKEAKVSASSNIQIDESLHHPSYQPKIIHLSKETNDKPLQINNYLVCNVQPNDKQKDSGKLIVNSVDNFLKQKNEYLIEKNNILQQYKKKTKPNAVMRLSIKKDSSHKPKIRHDKENSLPKAKSTNDNENEIKSLRITPVKMALIKECTDESNLTSQVDYSKKDDDIKDENEENSLHKTNNFEEAINNMKINSCTKQDSQQPINGKNNNMELSNHSVSKLFSLEIIQEEKKSKNQTQEIQSPRIDINNYSESKNVNGSELSKPLSYSDLKIDTSSHKIFISKDVNINAKINDTKFKKIGADLKKKATKRNGTVLKCTHSNNFSIISEDGNSPEKDIRKQCTNYFNQSQDQTFFNTDISYRDSKRVNESYTSTQCNFDLTTKKYKIGLNFERNKDKDKDKNNYDITPARNRPQPIINYSHTNHMSFDNMGISKEEKRRNNKDLYLTNYESFTNEYQSSEISSNSRTEHYPNFINSYCNKTNGFINKNRNRNANPNINKFAPIRQHYMKPSQWPTSLIKDSTNLDKLFENYRISNTISKLDKVVKQNINGSNILYSQNNSCLCQRCHNEIQLGINK